MNFFTGGRSAEAWLPGHPRVRGVVLTAERPIFSLGGAVARVPVEATAFPHGDASDDIIIVASWFPDEVGDADRHIAWPGGSPRRWSHTAVACT